ncbi:hypothetical protein B0H16DRAFT_314761 [Mycena metata]|uniref:Uncharacterized protein n=1 Tax=Mycena metata TaxID=1033252 RepID=A0AAD7NP60_9AGAR|nr:hypothetical protein B0H16DRAFT_314761 [Mycena metata]
MAQQRIPPIHDRRLVAQALSDAGLLGPKQPSEHIHRGGFVPPPRIHVEDETLGAVTLTLPGATVQPFFNFLVWFSHNNPEFKILNELVNLWARSHGFDLTPQTIALMVLGAMQSEEALFRDGLLDDQRWAGVEYSEGIRWNRIAVPVSAGFIQVPALPPAGKDVAAQFINFFIRWAQKLYTAHNHAFTVRNGRLNDTIPRNYTNAEPPRHFQFPKSSVDSPTRNFTPWCYEPLVIQDPFLVTIVGLSPLHSFFFLSSFGLEPCGEPLPIHCAKARRQRFQD